MRNIVLPLGGLILVGAVVAGAITTFGSQDSFGSRTSSRPLMTQSWGNYPRLTSDGRSLFVEGKRAMTAKNPEMERHGIQYQGIRDHKTYAAISVTLNGQTMSHEANAIESPLWWDESQTLYFIQSRKDAKDATLDQDQVWQWTAKEGFRAVSKGYNSLSRLTISPDGKFLAARLEDQGGRGWDYQKYLIVMPEQGRERSISYDDSSDNCIPLSENEVLIDGHNELGNQTYRWNFRRKKLTPIVRDASIVSITTLGTRVFGLHKRDRKFEIVEMNAKLDGWGATYDVPKGSDRKDVWSD